MRVARCKTREHGVFWRQKKHYISQQVLLYIEAYTALDVVPPGGREKVCSALHGSSLNPNSSLKRTGDYVLQVSSEQGVKSYCKAFSAPTAGSY